MFVSWWETPKERESKSRFSHVDKPHSCVQTVPPHTPKTSRHLVIGDVITVNTRNEAALTLMEAPLSLCVLVTE